MEGKIKLWLKNKVKELLKDEFVFQHEMNKNIEYRMDLLREIQENDYNEFKSLVETLQIGLDAHEYQSKSWAVVCIDGKPSYLKFYDLRQSDAKDMVQLLKHFEKDKSVVDAHPSFEKFFRDDVERARRKR